MRTMARSPRTARANRLVLGLIGLLLLAAGTATVLAGTGILGERLAREPVISPATDRFVADRPWFWPVGALAAAILAILSVRWLMMQLRTNRIHTLVLGPPARGRTTLRVSALGEAVERSIESIVGVGAASARFAGAPSRSWLTLVVTLNGRRKPGEIRRLIASRALSRLHAALGDAAPPAQVEFVLRGHPSHHR